MSTSKLDSVGTCITAAGDGSFVSVPESAEGTTTSVTTAKSSIERRKRKAPPIKEICDTTIIEDTVNIEEKMEIRRPQFTVVYESPPSSPSSSKRRKRNEKLLNRLQTPRPTQANAIIYPQPSIQSTLLYEDALSEAKATHQDTRAQAVVEDDDEQFFHYTHTPKRRQIRKSYRRAGDPSDADGLGYRSRTVSFGASDGSESDRSRSDSLAGIVGERATGGSAFSQSRNVRGMTPLLLAARCGNVDEVKRLLSSKTGGNVNCRDDRHFDALMYAARDGFTLVVKELIEVGGANANSVSSEGFSPLMYASLCGYPETCKALISGSADINACDSTGFTNLMGAAQNGHAETAELLLQGGADPNMVDSNGYSALVHASLHGCARLVAPLLKFGADIDQRTKFGSTALMHASHAGKAATVKRLLEGNANPKLKDAAGNTPLSLVARSLMVSRADVSKNDLVDTWKLLQPLSNPLPSEMLRKILLIVLSKSGPGPVSLSHVKKF
jgi:ankyrin repeat protein